VTVRYTREGPVAWLTIDRPEARNALSAAVRAGLWDGVRRFVADDAAVLVLTGAGDRAFCAGGDLKEMADAALEVLSAPAAEADEIWAPVYRSADAQEGPRAFREKRTPVWKGR